MSEIKNANGRPAWLKVNAIAKSEALVSMSNLTDSSKLHTTDSSIFFFLNLESFGYFRSVRKYLHCNQRLNLIRIPWYIIGVVREKA